MISYPPFKIGDSLEFKSPWHGIREPIESIEVLAIGIERNDSRARDAWRVKISVNGKPRSKECWSAGWFRKKGKSK